MGNDAFRLILQCIGDKRHAVPARLHGQFANRIQQLGLAIRTNEHFIAPTQHQQRSVSFCDLRFDLLLLGNVPLDRGKVGDSAFAVTDWHNIDGQPIFGSVLGIVNQIGLNRLSVLQMRAYTGELDTTGFSALQNSWRLADDLLPRESRQTLKSVVDEDDARAWQIDRKRLSDQHDIV